MSKHTHRKIKYVLRNIHLKKDLRNELLLRQSKGEVYMQFDSNCKNFHPIKGCDCSVLV